MKKFTKRLMVLFPSLLFEELENKAIEEEISKSAVVRKATSEYCNKNLELIFKENKEVKQNV